MGLLLLPDYCLGLWGLSYRTIGIIVVTGILGLPYQCDYRTIGIIVVTGLLSGSMGLSYRTIGIIVVTGLLSGPNVIR
jgi:hypothetical protein